MRRNLNEQLAYLRYVGDGVNRVLDIYTENVPGWAKVVYGREQSVREGATLPVTAIFCDGPVSWTKTLPGGETEVIAIPKLSRATAKQHADALRSALRGQFALDILDKAVEDWRLYKTQYHPAKMLVVAPDVETAVLYQQHLRKKRVATRIATYEQRDADDQIAFFRLTEGDRAADCLVTVAMCYEGLDVKQISHTVCLTLYRSIPWIEQASSRENRVDTEDSTKTAGFVYVPADRRMEEIMSIIQDEQPQALFHQEIGVGEEDVETVGGKRAKVHPGDSACEFFTSIRLDGEEAQKIDSRRLRFLDRVIAAALKAGIPVPDEENLDQILALFSSQSDAGRDETDRVLYERGEGEASLPSKARLRTIRSAVNKRVGDLSAGDLARRIGIYREIEDKFGESWVRIEDEETVARVLNWLNEGAESPDEVAYPLVA